MEHSRWLDVPDRTGVNYRWHLLDNGADPVAGTMLCVHGNPTWSFLWRRFVASAPPGWRVVAVDQLGMGWSDRPSRPRRLAERIDDLGDLTAALGIEGPVVTVAHDWGGPISVGWALAHRAQLTGMVLFNTAVQHDPGTAAPGLIRLARSALLRESVCVRTPIFVRGAAALSRPRLPQPVRQGLAQPYPDAASRVAIGDFVADIPLEDDHPSRAALTAVADGLAELTDVPALLLWGPRDPVFTARHLADLRARMPQADVQRYPRASHLVTEDVPEAAEHVWRWVQERSVADPVPAGEARALDRLPWAAQQARRDDPSVAVAEVLDGQVDTTSFAELETRIADLAAGLRADGVRPGDRVALLIPPGVDLTVAVYACWRAGAVIVVADAGLGLRGLGHALRSAAPDYVIGIRRALLAVRALGVPGRLIPAGDQPGRVGEALGWRPSLAELARRGAGMPALPPPHQDAEAAVLFTSGATGPAKGVVYTLTQLSAQIDLVRQAMGLTAEDRLVAAFAPFALYGPALGVGAVVPDMTVTAPATLTATALADAVAAIDATVVFASPAALRNVVATAVGLSEEQHRVLGGVRRVMSAGAPVPLPLLRRVAGVLPNAELHTPYGMTEALPVTDISLAQIEAAGVGNGVCVGQPLPGVRVRLSSLDALGRADGELTDEPEVTGEICVAGPHVMDHYDRLWVTQQASARNPGWHRTGDVGHLDSGGRLWVEGRLVHLITAAGGPVTPVGVEQRIEAMPGVAAAAVVGVGPTGTQQLVAVVVPPTEITRPHGSLAPSGLTAAIRAAVEVPVAAVLLARDLPTDIRHNSKIDRVAVGRWAGRILSGQRGGRW